MFAVFAMIPAVSPVSSMSATSRPNSANRDGDREKGRKERFHGTKVIVAASSFAFTESRANS
jgi:hypothetical protein